MFKGQINDGLKQKPLPSFLQQPLVSSCEEVMFRWFIMVSVGSHWSVSVPYRSLTILNIIPHVCPVSLQGGDKLSGIFQTHWTTYPSVREIPATL